MYIRILAEKFHGVGFKLFKILEIIEVLQGARLSLNGFIHYRFLRILLLFSPFWGSRASDILLQNRRYYDLIAHQVC